MFKRKDFTTKRKLILLLAMLLVTLVIGRMIATSVKPKPVIKTNPKTVVKTVAPTQTPTPVPVVQNTPTGVEQYRPLVAKYFGNETDNALVIMSAESGGNPQAISATNDYGLFQINQVHAGRVGGNLSQLLDPETNVKVAYAIFSEQGWHPWSTSWRLSSGS